MTVGTAPARSALEAETLNLSVQRFRWKTAGDIEAAANLLHDELVFVHLNGHITSKSEWIGQLRSGRFIYNAIDVK